MAKPEQVFAPTHASCRIAPFRRFDVSKVCHCGGDVLTISLGVCRSQKCRSDELPVMARMTGPNYPGDDLAFSHRTRLFGFSPREEVL
jgi:hypothetical protein